MKIRDKLFLGFGMYLVFAIAFAALAYKDLNTISTHLAHLEIADDITNNLLEVRRYEKNYLLYGDRGSLEDIGKYLSVMKDGIAKIRDEAVRNIGDDHIDRMMKSIAEYEQRLSRLGRIRKVKQQGTGDRLLALQREEDAEVERLRGSPGKSRSM